MKLISLTIVLFLVLLFGCKPKMNLARKTISTDKIKLELIAKKKEFERYLELEVKLTNKSKDTLVIQKHDLLYTNFGVAVNEWQFNIWQRSTTKKDSINLITRVETGHDWGVWDEREYLRISPDNCYHFNQIIDFKDLIYNDKYSWHSIAIGSGNYASYFKRNAHKIYDIYNEYANKEFTVRVFYYDFQHKKHTETYADTLKSNCVYVKME